MLHAARRPSSVSPRSDFVPHAQASAPPRIYGKRLELAEGTSPRELPCLCANKAGRHSKARRGVVPSLSQRRIYLSLSLPNPSDQKRANIYEGIRTNDSNSPKVYRRESCLASVQIKPVSTPKHTELLCLLYLSDDVVSPCLPPHLAPGVQRYSAIAFVLEERLSSLG